MHFPLFLFIKRIFILALFIFCGSQLAEAQSAIIPGLPDTICAGRTDTILFYRDPNHPFDVQLGNPPFQPTIIDNEISNVAAFPISGAIVTIDGNQFSPTYGLVLSAIPPGTASVNVSMEYTSTEDNGQGIQLTNFFSAFHNIIIIDTFVTVSSPVGTNVCVNDIPFHLSTNFSGGTFSGPGVNALGRFNPSIAGAGTHTINYSVNFKNCPLTGSITITVAPQPNASLTLPNGVSSSFCTSDPDVQLIGSPTNGSTSAYVGAGVGAQGLFSPSSVVPGIYDIDYIFENNGGCRDTARLTLTVSSGSQASITSPSTTTFCNGTSTPITLQASPAGGTFSGPGVNATTGAFSPSLANIGNNIIYYNITGSCASYDSVILTVNATPNPTISLPNGVSSTFCTSNSSIQLLGTPTSGGVGGFSGPGTTLGGIFDPAQAGTGTHTLVFNFTGSNGCSESDDLIVTVATGTVANINAPATNTFCVNDAAITLTASPTGGTFSGPGVSASGVFDPAQAGTGLYVLYYDYGSGACASRDSVTLGVLTPPTASISLPAGVSSTVCSNSPSIIMVGSPTLNGTGVFSGAGIAINNTTGEFTPNLAGVGTYDLIYEFTNSNNCSDADTITVSVVNGNPATITPPSPSTLCTNAVPINIQASPTGGTFSGPGTNSTGRFDPRVAGAGTHRIYYNISASGCSSVDSVDLVVNQAPTVSMNTGSNQFCLADPSVQLQGSPNSGNFSGPGASGAGNTGIFDPAVAGIGTHTITFSFTNAAGCTDTDVQTFVVDPNPTPIFSGLLPSYLTTDAPAALVSGNSAAGTFSFTGSNIVNNAGNYSFDPSLTGTGTKLVTYTYTASTGCSATLDSTVVVTSSGGGGGGNSPITFTNNDPGAPATMEACIGSRVSFNYTDFTDHPGEVQLNSTTGPPIQINTLNISNQTGNGNNPRSGTVTFTIPANAITGPVVFLRTGVVLDTADQLLVIHNPAVDFLAQNAPICATDTRITLFGFPSGGTFSSVDPGILSGSTNNILDPSQIGWPASTNVDSLMARISYNYTPTYSNGAPCPQATAVTKDLTVYDNRLNRVTFATLSQQNAAAGNQALSLDAGVSNMVISTRPDILCNTDPNSLLIPCFPHSFSGAFVDQNNNFLSPVAGGRNLVRLEYDNNGCIGSATGFIDILGALVIYNLPDTLCRISTALFERDPSLDYVDTTITANNGNIRHIITNQLLRTYTTNPSHQAAITNVNTTPGQESYRFIPFALANNVTQVIVNMEYLSITTLDNGLGNIDTTFLDNFTITDTVNIISGLNTSPFSIGNLKSSYCANEVGDTLFPSFAFLGPSSNILYFLSARVGGGLDTTYLVNNYLDPAALYNSLVPSGVGDLTLSLAYEISYYGCPDAMDVGARPTVVIRAPLTPSFTHNGSYCQGDAPDTLQRGALPVGATETFSGAGTLAASPGVFYPGLAAPTQNYISYTLTDQYSCSYVYSDSILVTPGPVIELTLDGSNTLDEFCYDNNVVVVSSNITSSPSGTVISSTTYHGVAVGNVGPSTIFNPSIIYANGDTTTPVWVEITDNSGCFSSDTAYVTVVHPPTISMDSAFNFIKSPYYTNPLDSSEHTYCRSAGDFFIDGVPSHTTTNNSFNQITGTGVRRTGLNYEYFPNLVSSESDTVIFYYADALGCTNTDTAIIKIDSIPTVILSGLPSSIVCDNTPAVQLTAFPAPSTGQASFSGPGLDSTGLFNPTTAGIGLHRLVYAYAGATGCPNNDTLQVTIEPAPRTNITGYQTIYCSNAPDDVLISNNFLNQGGSYQFYGDIVVPGTDTIRPGLGVYTPTPRKVYYTYTNPNGCSLFDSVGITVYPEPVVSINGIKDRYCANGNPTDFQVLPVGGNLLSTDTAFVLNNSFITLTPPHTDTGNTTVIYTFTDGNGCSNTDTATTYIQPVDIPSIVGLDPFYCQVSDTVFITGSLPGGYFIGSGIDSTINGDWYFVPSRAQVGPNRIQYVIPGSITAPGQPLVCRADTIATTTVRPRLAPNLISPVDNSRFCSTDSLVRFVYDDLNLNTIHTFRDTSNAVAFLGYTRYDTIGVNRDTIVISSDTAFHLDPGSATQVANFINYVVEDTITGCKDSIRLTYVIDQHVPISYQLDSAYCEAEDSVDMIINPRDGILTRDGDTIVPSSPGAPYLFYTKRQDGITAPLTVTILDTVTYQVINGACISEKTQLVEIHPVFPISFWTDSTHNTYCLGGDTVALHTNDTGSVFSGTGVRTGTDFFIPDLAEAGIHPITMEYTDSVTGCYSQFVDTLYVYGVPTLDFDVAGGCQFDSITFIPNNALLNLNNLFQNEYIDSITGVWWQVEDTVVLFDSTGKRDSITSIVYQYNSPGVYNTKLIVANQVYCRDTQTIRIVISPKVTSYPYTVNFENDNGNWFAESQDSSYRLLWEWGIDSTIGGTSLNNPNNNVNHIWSTQNNARYEARERAWVYGPCFDLSSLTRPMISLDYWSDAREPDGTILEYQKPDGTWANLGELYRGINWYDDDFITSQPGNQINIPTRPVGWGGNSLGWKNGRYKLDDINTGNRLVRLRIAFASVDIPLSANEFFDGFAFDNVVVKNRNRNVLLETFANIGYTNMEAVNEHSYQLVHHTALNKDVIMLQYQMESPNVNDMFFLHNEALGRNRAYEYSASAGRSLIDGNGLVNAYITADLAEIDFEQDMLEDAKFAVRIDTFFHANGNFQIRATATALTTMDSANYRIYTVLSEDSLYYPSGSSYNNPIHAVARENDQFHTNVAVNTQNIFGQSWRRGQSQSVSFDWNHAAQGFINYRPNCFHAVVFVQDIDTKEIFQVATTRDVSGYWVGIEPIEAEEELNELQSLNLFPNPAHDYFNLKFDQALEHDYQWKLFNIQGVEIQQGTLQAGTDQFLVDGLDAPAGTYVLLLHNDKVFVQRKVVLGRP